ncbi:MAG: hypothetical protein CMF67_05400 [Magnetovibrio sp.]|nr:hypothetical protein [Magnetovibrio sp.]
MRDQEEVKGELTTDCGSRAILNPHFAWPIDHYLIPTQIDSTTNNIGQNNGWQGIVNRDVNFGDELLASKRQGRIWDTWM